MKKNSPATAAGAKTLKRFQDLPGEHRVVVGLSGGVDSSLTAALLAEAGWEVNGLTLWLMSGKGACCSDGLIDAAGICDELGITHHIVDSRETFEKEIVNNLIKGYEKGITPLPCSQCNRSVKFRPMIDWARTKLNTNIIATGHYARIRKSNEKECISGMPGMGLRRNKLLRGIDRNKDQSYFLYDINENLLDNIIFPLGELTKEDTRKEAARHGLRTADKPESQDLCLIDLHGSMKDFLAKHIPEKEGKILLPDGTILGTHNGIHNFTIGQRKGLGVSWKEPLHVIRIEADTNEIYVAPRALAGKSKCIVGRVNWISIDPPKQAIDVEVQLRYRSQPTNAKLTPTKPTDYDLSNSRPYRCELVFEHEQFSITPGQAAVFYSGDVVLGGGIIIKD